MKSLTRILIFSFLPFLTVGAFGQTTKEPVDAKAKGILDEVAKQTKTHTTIKAEFSIASEKQVTNTESKVTDTQTGSLQLKGNKYKLQFKGQTVFCDGKTQWTYIKDGNEAQIENAPDPNATDNPNPVNIFTIYEKGYKYKYEKEDVAGGAKVDIINLYPLEPDKKAYHTIRLTIDKVKKQIVGAKIINKNGTSSNITLKNFTPNADIPDATFTFNKAEFPGVVVEDLR